jgi:enoyl-CoA hydratase/carnithine racemase
MARDGRGRLDSFDLMPEAGQEDLAWAMEQLNARKRPQTEILSDLNGRLADKGLPLISKSAFNRKAVRVAMAARRVSESRAIFAGLADQFTPEHVDEGNIVIGEMIKLLIMEHLDAGPERIATKGAMELARGYLAVIQAQKISAARRTLLEEQFKAKAGDALEKAAKATGLSAETRDRLKAEILGIQSAP